MEAQRSKGRMGHDKSRSGFARGHGFALDAGFLNLELHFPELPDEGIADLLHDPASVGGINEHTVHAD